MQRVETFTMSNRELVKLVYIEWLKDILEKEGGVENIEDMSVLRLQPINQHGTPIEIINSFGGKEKYLEALKELEDQIYKMAS